MTATTAPTAPAVCTVTPEAATEPGALDGFRITCSRCGDAGKRSLEGMAHREAATHEAWHRRYQP